MLPSLSIVIPTHQRPSGLRELLLSLADQDFSREALEIHVVGNLPDDGGEAVVQSLASLFRHLTWHCVGQKGVNRARNLGLSVARNDLVLFLDDDCVIPNRYYLSSMAQAHCRFPDAVAIGGGYFAPAEASQVEVAYDTNTRYWINRRVERTGQVINLVGGNVCYKKDLLETLQLSFNENIEFGGAETDLHIRIFQAGGKLHFEEGLDVEHRAKVSPYQLVRKAFLQGYSAQIRWRKGLFVPTVSQRSHPYGTGKDLWRTAFQRAYSLGWHYAKGRGEQLPQPGPVLFFGVRFYIHSLYMHVRSELRRVTLHRTFAKPRRPEVELPLSRFYVLPVSTECPKDCSYSGALGCRKVKAGTAIEAELERAKAYGFRDVLLPCNLVFQENRVEIVKQVAAAGLRPFALLNGDEAASISMDEIKELEEDCDFHLLLGPASEYQKSLTDYLIQHKPDFTATYLHQGWRLGVKLLRQLPSTLSFRVHFLFPAIGDLWHPHPSCVEINRFLQKVARAIKNPPLCIRGPAGFWPIERGARAQTEPWPRLEPRFEFGKPGQSIRFSVIIPAFDAADHLPKVLRSLARQDIGTESFEVIIVDDGSRDGTEWRLRDFLNDELKPEFYLRYFYWARPEGELTFRAGLIRNLGASYALGDYLCFIDSDILVPPDYLSDLDQRFVDNDVIQSRREMLNHEASQECVGYQGFAETSVYSDSPYWENFKAARRWRDLYHYWKYTCTYALSMRKSLFLRAGWFSPEFYSYGFEDVDLGYRCARLGANFFLSQNAVYHLYPSRSQLSYHFDERARTRALTLSSRVFYRHRLDPEIFNEFYPAFFQPVRGELKILASRIVWRVWDILLWRDVIAWKIWQVVLVPALKPYFFLRYQFQKRWPRQSEIEVSRVEY